MCRFRTKTHSVETRLEDSQTSDVIDQLACSPVAPAHSAPQAMKQVRLVFENELGVVLGPSVEEHESTHAERVYELLFDVRAAIVEHVKVLHEHERVHVKQVRVLTPHLGLQVHVLLFHLKICKYCPFLKRFCFVFY
jgi:hypothetical protein